MTNKYVDFVTDEDFLECVKYVCDAYPKLESKVDMKKLKRNALDQIKLLFDTHNQEIDLIHWITGEKIRQTDKTISNKIGDFHQKLLGKVAGWEDLGRGDPLGIDLKKQDNSVFIELKNKHNTVKGENHKDVFDKLVRVLEQYPTATIYYAFIIPKRPSSGEKIWNPSRREPNPQIKEIWGSKIYEIVTGDKDALQKVIDAIPKAIKDITKTKHALSKKDEDIITEIFKEE